MSYKWNLFLLLSTLLRFELTESFLLLCQTNKSLYSTNHNITTKKMNNLEVEVFCDAIFKHEPSPAWIFNKVLNPKGKVQSKNKLLSNERAWKCKTTSHHWPQCANGSRDNACQNHEFEQDGRHQFVGFYPHFHLNMTSQRRILQDNEKIKMHYLRIISFFFGRKISDTLFLLWENKYFVFDQNVSVAITTKFEINLNSFAKF